MVDKSELYFMENLLENSVVDNSVNVVVWWHSISHSMKKYIKISRVGRFVIANRNQTCLIGSLYTHGKLSSLVSMYRQGSGRWKLTRCDGSFSMRFYESTCSWYCSFHDWNKQAESIITAMTVATGKIVLFGNYDNLCFSFLLVCANESSLFAFQD